MSNETITQAYQATGVIPAAPWRLRAISILSEWRLAATFNDGVTGTVDLSGLVNGSDPGVFEPLRDPVYFAKAYLDCGAVTWPNGADLAPDAMHKEINRSGIYRISE